MTGNKVDHGEEEAAMRRTTPEEKSFTIRIAASSSLTP